MHRCVCVGGGGGLFFYPPPDLWAPVHMPPAPSPLQVTEWYTALPGIQSALTTAAATLGTVTDALVAFVGDIRPNTASWAAPLAAESQAEMLRAVRSAAAVHASRAAALDAQTTRAVKQAAERGLGCLDAVVGNVTGDALQRQLDAVFPAVLERSARALLGAMEGPAAEQLGAWLGHSLRQAVLRIARTATPAALRRAAMPDIADAATALQAAVTGASGTADDAMGAAAQGLGDAVQPGPKMKAHVAAALHATVMGHVADGAATAAQRVLALVRAPVAAAASDVLQSLFTATAPILQDVLDTSAGPGVLRGLHHTLYHALDRAALLLRPGVNAAVHATVADGRGFALPAALLQPLSSAIHAALALLPSPSFAAIDISALPGLSSFVLPEEASEIAALVHAEIRRPVDTAGLTAAAIGRVQALVAEVMFGAQVPELMAALGAAALEGVSGATHHVAESLGSLLTAADPRLLAGLADVGRSVAERFGPEEGADVGEALTDAVMGLVRPALMSQIETTFQVRGWGWRGCGVYCGWGAWLGLRGRRDSVGVPVAGEASAWGGKECEGGRC